MDRKGLQMHLLQCYTTVTPDILIERSYAPVLWSLLTPRLSEQSGGLYDLTWIPQVSWSVVSLIHGSNAGHDPDHALSQLCADIGKRVLVSSFLEFRSLK